MELPFISINLSHETHLQKNLMAHPLVKSTFLVLPFFVRIPIQPTTTIGLSCFGTLSISTCHDHPQPQDVDKLFPLTHNDIFCIFASPQSEFLSLHS